MHITMHAIERYRERVEGASRRYAKSRARHLAWKHSVEWQPPVAPISADEIEALKAQTIGSLRP